MDIIKQRAVAQFCLYPRKRKGNRQISCFLCVFDGRLQKMAQPDGPAMFGLTASGIPVSHLDYKYVGKCTSGEELEKILKVLRSGEEGTYPELVEFTEKRLSVINPKSKALRKEIPIQSYNDLDTSEREEVSEEFENWFSEISQKDSLLKKASKDPSNSDFLPPIRSARTIGSTTTGSAQVSNGNRRESKKGSVLPRGYEDWDKFNPDEELKAMEEKEEKELKNKKEKAKINCKEAEIPDKIETAGKTDEELKLLAEHEKNKGNEAFQSEDYKESLVYYSRSIQYKPSAAAYNNRAFAHLKLNEYEEAILDCNVVISLEPNNLKAFLRRAIAYKEKGDLVNTRKDLNKVLDIEPNNKRAKGLLGEINKEKSEPVDSLVNGNTQPKKKGKRMKIIEIENEDENEKEPNTSTESSDSVTPTVPDLPKDNAPHYDDFRDSSSNVKNDVSDDKTNGVVEEMDGKAVTENGSENKDGNASKEIAEIGHREISVSERQPPKEPQPVVELPGMVVKVKDEGTSFFKLGRYAEAAEKFAQAVEVLEKDKSQFKSALASLLYNRAACLSKMGDAPGCIKDCNASLDLIPGAVKPLIKRAAAQEMLERFKLSYLDYEAALFIDSTNSQAQEGRSRVAKHLSNMYGREWRKKLEGVQIPSTPVSSELLDTETTNSQDEPELNVIKGAVNRGQKKQTAEYSTKQSATLTFSKAEMFEKSKEKGNAFVKQGKLEQAVKCYTDCIQLDPNKVVSYTNRALCYLKLNKYAQAVQDSTKALDLEPRNVKALYRRALAKKGLREYDTAAKDLLNLIKIDPNNTAGKKELDTVLNLCREERREKQKTAPEIKPKNEEKPDKTSKTIPTNQQGQQNKNVRRRRVQIEEVNAEEEDSSDIKTTPSTSSTSSQESSCPLLGSGKTTKTATPSKPEQNRPTKDNKQKKIKLNKTTAFDFYQAWTSVKKNDFATYADILRQMQPALLPKVLSNKLDADMFRSIVQAVADHILPKGEARFAFGVLQYVCKAERFDMALMFLDNKDLQAIRELFAKLESARANDDFVDVDTFNNVLSKYKLKG